MITRLNLYIYFKFYAKKYNLRFVIYYRNIQNIPSECNIKKAGYKQVFTSHSPCSARLNIFWCSRLVTPSLDWSCTVWITNFPACYFRYIKLMMIQLYRHWPINKKGNNSASILTETTWIIKRKGSKCTIYIPENRKAETSPIGFPINL